MYHGIETWAAILVILFSKLMKNISVIFFCKYWHGIWAVVILDIGLIDMRYMDWKYPGSDQNSKKRNWSKHTALSVCWTWIRDWWSIRFGWLMWSQDLPRSTIVFRMVVPCVTHGTMSGAEDFKAILSLFWALEVIA